MSRIPSREAKTLACAGAVLFVVFLCHLVGWL